MSAKAIDHLPIEVTVEPRFQAEGWEWWVRVPGERNWEGVSKTRDGAITAVHRALEEAIK
jgi:hypothetical protein